MVRFGILGFGLHAVRRLMPGFALARNSCVSALSRRDLDQARDSARRSNIALAFDSAEALCQSPEVDAVFVATPNACHAQDVLVAIRHGKPVLCEKPMGVNADECRVMVQTARAAGVLLGVAHVFRFGDSPARFRAHVSSGDIGKAVFARSEFSYPGLTHPRTWIINAALAGGGPIADVGVHCVDALRYILQDEVARVSARAISDANSGDVEAAAVLTLEFSHGTLGTVLVSTRAPYRTPLEIVGDRATLSGEDALNVERAVSLQLRHAGATEEVESVSNQLAYARQVDAFAAAVEGKAAFPVPGEQGWQNQEILDAAYRSLKSGRAEEVLQVLEQD
jgi:predicted dehydrogenase